MFCIECGAENGEGLSFCTSCGAPLDKGGPGPGTAPAAVRCPACGAANEAGGAYCIACGAELGGGRQRPGGAGRARRAAVAVSLSLLAAAVCASAGLLALHRAGALPEAVEDIFETPYDNQQSEKPEEIEEVRQDDRSQPQEESQKNSNQNNKGNNADEVQNSSDANENTANNVNGDTSTTRVASFPRTWKGSYTGTTSGQTISRTLAFTFYDVYETGKLQGVCNIGVDDTREGSTVASYYVEGYVDWNTNSFEVYGTSWINQGDLASMRRFQGNYDQASNSISGSTVTLSNEYKTKWSVYAFDA